MESQCRTHDVEALNAGGARIYHKHVPLRITDHLQYMGMPAYKYIRAVLFDEFPCTCIVSAGISSYMGHQNLKTFAHEETMKRMIEAKAVIVTIACNTDQRLEGSHFLSKVKSSTEISGMPYLVHRFEEISELCGKHPVSI